jgi:hypothetical protein
VDPEEILIVFVPRFIGSVIKIDLFNEIWSFVWVIRNNFIEFIHGRNFKVSNGLETKMRHSEFEFIKSFGFQVSRVEL